jgi:hypothetical protein
VVLAARPPFLTGKSQVFAATRASVTEGFGEAVELLELDVNGNAYVWPTWISADSCVIYVTTTPGPGDFDPEHTDLYVAVRGR